MKESGVRNRRTDEQGISNFEGIKWESHFNGGRNYGEEGGTNGTIGTIRLR
jgi:hypothetical protein